MTPARSRASRADRHRAGGARRGASVRDRAAALRERAALGDRASALRERAPVERVRRRRAAEAAALAAAAPLPAVPPTGTGRIRPEHSHTADLGGPVHWVEHEAQGEVTGPPVVCVHGLGGSHANWHDLAPLLAQHRRVVALDLAGFGRTPRAGRSASVRANRALLDRFLAEVVGEPAVLVGNSMGGTLSVLEAAAHPERVVELVLIGPAGPRPRRELPDAAVARQAALFAVPGVAEKVLVRRLERLGAEGWVRQQMSLTTVDASRVSEQMRQAAVDLVASRAAGPDAEAAFLEAARSLVALLARAARYRDAVCSVRAPALVVHGALDRLVPVSCSRALVELRPDWQLEVLDGVGHVPQIEVPGRTAEVIGAWLERDRTAHPEPVEAPHDH